MSLPRQNSQLVDADGRPTREFYTWMRGLMAQTAEAEASAPAVSELSDVAISSLTDGDALVYDNSIGRWVNGAGGGGGYDEGTSFPGSPATGDKFYRTDLNWLCFYDGTRWLTCHEYTETLGMQSLALPATTTPFAIAYIGTRRDYQLYIRRFTLHPFVATTNGGGNYWTIDARWANSANVQTSLGTSNTSAGAANTNLDCSITINAPLNTGSFYIEIQATKTGSPGSFYLWGSMTYRLIVT